MLQQSHKRKNRQAQVGKDMDQGITRKQRSCNTDPTYEVSQLPLIQDARCQGAKETMVQDTFCLNARMQT